MRLVAIVNWTPNAMVRALAALIVFLRILALFAMHRKAHVRETCYVLVQMRNVPLETLFPLAPSARLLLPHAKPIQPVAVTMQYVLL